jgi:putative iron-only hydrogenase system regulator
MEKRIGVMAILIEKRDNIHILNSLISEYSDLILGRQGLPLRDKGIHIISLVLEGTTDQIGALAGKIGKLQGVQVKSVLTRYMEKNDENNPVGEA